MIRTFFSILLLPLTIWYAVAIVVRNLFYRTGIFKREKHEIPTICVGNLSTGGTGKTPHTEYLIQLLCSQMNVAVLSRGYGRKTTGFILADESATALTIGDEPLQFYKKFKNITVAVCEKRNIGVKQLSKLQNPPNVIILDDAFQHKSIIPSTSILLTEYAKPFYNDYILPYGNLREFRRAYKTADIIIITKCPQSLTDLEKQRIIRKINHKPTQKVFFSAIKYGNPVPLNNSLFSDFENLLIVSGIANPKPLYDFLGKNYQITKMEFPDHHVYSKKDICNIRKQFDEISSSSKAIITTEKDTMRLRDIIDIELFDSVPVFYLPIEIYFLDTEKQLDDIVGSL